MMQPRDQVQSLSKGLRLLTALNHFDGASLVDLAGATGMNRTTVFRLVETLVQDGFVARASADRLYRPTVQTRALSGGFHDAAWVDEIAATRLIALGRAIDWPLALATYAGSHMLVRFTTDSHSTLVFRRVPAGTRASLTGSAAGRLFLAHADRALVDDAVKMAQTTKTFGDLPEDILGLDEDFARIRANGYCALHRHDRRFYFISVPILPGDKVIGCITLRIINSAMTLATALARYVGPMKIAAGDIAADYTASA